MEAKRILLPFFSSLLFLTSSCNPQESAITYEEPSPVQKVGSSKSGITITLAETKFASSPSGFYAIIQNENNYECSYGKFFYIDRKLNGQWFSVVFLESTFYKYPDFTDLGLVLKGNSSVYQSYMLSQLNIDLSKGEYRLVKTLSCPAADGNEISVSAEFDVD